VLFFLWLFFGILVEVWDGWLLIWPNGEKEEIVLLFVWMGKIIVHMKLPSPVVVFNRAKRVDLSLLVTKVGAMQQRGRLKVNDWDGEEGLHLLSF